MNIKKNATKLSSLFFGLTLAFSASANLVENGSFENPDIDTTSGITGGSFWQIFNSDDVQGWDGNNVEIWDSTSGIAAVDGDQFIELNSGPEAGPFTLFQDLATTINTAYSLTFHYRARVDAGEAFTAGVSSQGEEGVLSFFDAVTDHIVGAWSQYTYNFIADSAITRISFTTTTGETLGNFIDDVRVTAVPEPGSLALLGLGLLGLGFARRRQPTG